MAKKTNKTSHVLNLLTNGTDPEETSGQDLAEERNTEKQEKAVAEAAPMESAPQISASGDKRIVVVEDQEEDISNKILDNLEKQLESQEAQKAGQESQEARVPVQEAQAMVQESQPQVVAQESQSEAQGIQPKAAVQESQTNVQESQPEAVAQESQTKVQESQLVAREVQSQIAAQESAAQEPQNKEEEYRQIGTQRLQDLAADFGEEECHIENVMENIISRTDLKKYMNEYGVCKCSRCCADVKALILTRLPSKYVVVQKDSVAPMIGFYENKFRVMIFTEILKACLQVKERPRHNP